MLLRQKFARILVALALVSFCPAEVFAFGWPSVEPLIRKTFGQHSGKNFLPGVEISSTQREVRSPNVGEVLFLFNPIDQKTQKLPSALGGFIVLNHDANLRTAVSNIQFPARVGKDVYQKGEIMGSLNFEEGASAGLIRLFVFDQQVGNMVNPFLILPPPLDQKSPLIYDVTLEGEAGVSSQFSLFNKSSVGVGFWKIILETADVDGPRGAEFLRGVHSIQAFLNGTDIYSLSFDAMMEKNGQWVVKGMDKPLSGFYVGERQWNLGQVFLNQGTNILEIVVKDFAGNETAKTFRIMGTR